MEDHKISTRTQSELAGCIWKAVLGATLLWLKWAWQFSLTDIDFLSDIDNLSNNATDKK